MPHRFLHLADPRSLPAGLAHPVVAIGNFDGVHQGHRHLIAHAGALAARLARPLAVLTFDPHPRRLFQPTAPHFVLTPPEVQGELMAGIGVQGLIALTFDAALAAMEASAFIDQLLVDRLGVAGVAVGAGFRFGKGRGGDVAMLEAAGQAKGFAVTVAPQVMDAERPVSSTRVREALAAGAMDEARRLLGYAWFVRGPVIHGEKRGRDLGYPTANMALASDCRLRHGVYAVKLRIDGVVRDGVASFGRRPMFDNGAPLLETHVFDYAGDLYGKVIDVAFIAFLREEQTFDGLDGLIAQMDRDSARARILLAATKI